MSEQKKPSKVPKVAARIIITTLSGKHRCFKIERAECSLKSEVTFDGENEKKKTHLRIAGTAVEQTVDEFRREFP